MPVPDPGNQSSKDVVDPDEPTPDEHDPAEDNDESDLVVPPDRLTPTDEDAST